MDKEILGTEIQSYLKSEGADIVGFANLTKLPADVRNDFPYGISIAVTLDPEIIRKIINGPDLEYLQEYRRANELLGFLGEKAARLLEDKGYRAKSFSSKDSIWKWPSLRGRVPRL